MKCHNCGMDIPNEASFCTNCGARVENNNISNNQNQLQQNNEGSAVGWGFLGFFFPLVGLILFFVFKKDRPKASKASGIGALIGTILCVIFYVIISIIVSLGFNDAREWINNNYDEDKVNNYINDVEDKVNDVIEDQYEKDINKKNETSSDSSSSSVSKQNALRKAKQYLDYSAFSYKGLIKQLEFEKFSNEDATYAADRCGADWNEQAVKKAKQYLDYSAFSHDGLVKQLEFEGFTHEQAEYGVTKNGL